MHICDIYIRYRSISITRRIEYITLTLSIYICNYINIRRYISTSMHIYAATSTGTGTTARMPVGMHMHGMDCIPDMYTYVYT